MDFEERKMVVEVVAFDDRPDEDYAHFQVELTDWAYDIIPEDLDALNWADGERRRFTLVPL